MQQIQAYFCFTPFFSANADFDECFGDKSYVWILLQMDKHQCSYSTTVIHWNPLELVVFQSKQNPSFFTPLEGICKDIYWSMEDVQISNLDVAEKYLFQMYFLLILSILLAIFIPEPNSISCQLVTYPLYFVLIHVASRNVVEYKSR